MISNVLFHSWTTASTTLNRSGHDANDRAGTFERATNQWLSLISNAIHVHRYRNLRNLRPLAPLLESIHWCNHWTQNDGTCPPPGILSTHASTAKQYWYDRTMQRNATVSGLSKKRKVKREQVNQHSPQVYIYCIDFDSTLQRE